MEAINPNATIEAKNLLKFLYEIDGKYTLTGQHNFVSSGSKYDEVVFEITGKEPVVWGSDFSFMAGKATAANVHHCGPMNMSDPLDPVDFNSRSVADLRQSMIDEAKRKYAEGKIITLMWHGCFPTSGAYCNGEEIWAMENRPSTETIDSMTTPGTALNLAWKKQADGIVFYLKQLQEAHIPVLWRPYHEMNGVWFWWCNQREGFTKLWRMMYDYFTNEQQLNNLIWVWDANAPRDKKGDEAFAYDLFYPGNDYVDVLAADVYANDYKQSHHDQLIELGKGKPIALGEIGGVPNDSILQTQTNWTWFIVWGYFINKYNKAEDVKAMYNNPRMLTLDRIERNEEGEYIVK